MNIITTLLSAIIGFVVGYVFNVFGKFLKRCYYEKKNKELLDVFSKQDFTQLSNGTVLLAHGVPTYKVNDIEMGVNDYSFYYPIPVKYKKILSSYGFVQNNSDDFRYIDTENCLHESFWGKTNFDKGFSSLVGYTWDEAKKEVSEIANIVAENFITDLQKGQVRFNGAMFGVSSFNPNRAQGDEHPTIKMVFYTTDYFSYHVFSQFYQKHQLKEKELPTDIIDKLSYPFLSSFGVAVIAVISTNKITSKLQDSDIIVIGKRSNKVIVHQGLLHFTMNEAFSLRDTNHDEPSLGYCAYRGFKEELKWSKSIPGMVPSNIKFMDFGFNANDGEMGVTGYVKLSTIEGKTLTETAEYLNNLYKESQDGILETDGLVFVPIKEARSFLQANKDQMCAGFATSLENFLRRYELSLL